MTSDFDDTVSLPLREPTPVVALPPDLEDTTITWQRPATAPVALVEPPPPPAPPKVTTAPIAVVDAAPASHEPVAEASAPDSRADDLDDTTGPARAGAPIPILNPELIDNVWLQPLPSAPRPFRIRLDDGTLVPLDQPVYLGRRPSVPRIHPGGVPLLVTLDSPQREVSSTHLVLSTVGGAIVARDLRSSNGSIVRVPGSAAHTLLGGESTVVTPGTVIELGDGNSIELLAPDHPEDDRTD